jgi:hypothetical protein
MDESDRRPGPDNAAVRTFLFLVKTVLLSGAVCIADLFGNWIVIVGSGSTQGGACIREYS